MKSFQNSRLILLLQSGSLVFLSVLLGILLMKSLWFCSLFTFFVILLFILQVLIYVALLDHKSAILGDAGINAKVPADFWDSIMKNMIAKFKEGKITEGICEAVISAGEQLKVYFPYQADDVNELPDEISFQ